MARQSKNSRRRYGVLNSLVRVQIIFDISELLKVELRRDAASHPRKCEGMEFGCISLSSLLVCLPLTFSLFSLFSL